VDAGVTVTDAVPGPGADGLPGDAGAGGREATADGREPGGDRPGEPGEPRLGTTALRSGAASAVAVGVVGGDGAGPRLDIRI
jgi:hypothetical protein